MPDAGKRGAIERLLRPRSIAIVGASPTPGSLGNGVMGNLARFGFKGEVHLVNPGRAEIDGKPCFKTPADLPEGVDCVVLAIPGKGVLDAARQCATRGVGGLIVFGAGFAEAGEEGRAAQAELAKIARDAGMALEGPNCLGMVNFVDGVCLTFGVAQPRPVKGPGLAIASQSGAMATVLRAALHARDIDVTYTVSTGNEAVNGLEDFLGFIVEEPHTRAIALVAEQMRDPRRFLESAARAKKLGKTIVLLHPGRGQAARESAQTHTGALAGDWEVMRAVASHAGACVVETLEELIDVSEMLLRCPPVGPGGVAMITDSGAFKGMTLDYCEEIGLDLPQPGDAARETIGALAPGLIFPVNPIDLTAQALVDPELYKKTMRPLLDDDRYAAIVFGVILSSPVIARRKNQPILDAVREFNPNKPVILAMLGDESEVPADLVAEFRSIGVPFIRSPERALRALARLSRHQAEPRGVAPAMHGAGKKLPPGVLPEFWSKSLLAPLGVPVPPGGLAQSMDEAQGIARGAGYPVALKAQAAALSHKSDAGGVMLGIRDDEHLARAWQELFANLARARPDLSVDGVLVEAMAPRGVELIIGARNDPDWGPVLMIGLGGVFSEALKDSRVMSAALPAEDIVREIGKLKGARLLQGFRGDPPRDIEAAAAVAETLGAFVRAHPEIAEVDLNPVVVFPQGQGALALDALIYVR